jgi:hypothetical protein
MIHILFVPGMFGSMIEYVLRSHTCEGDELEADIKNDGSMHTFSKNLHIVNWGDNISSDSFKNSWITTPIYPEKNTHLSEILENIKSHCDSWISDKKILMYADSFGAAEINMLFQYYKISIGLGLGIDVFCDSIKNDAKNWNNNYQSWHDMQLWQLREWFSIFYPDWISEWQDSVNQVGDDFLKISNSEIIDNTVDTIQKIITFCNLTVKDNKKLTDFLYRYRAAQDYILQEYAFLKTIVNAVIHKQPLQWKQLNIISESIIQQNLRYNGYEIKCDGLNQFPTDSITLHNLLDKRVIHC